MSELKNRDDIVAFVQERMENGFAEFERTMDAFDAAVRIERERCRGWAMRVEPPYVNDLVRSGAWNSATHQIELKIMSGEFPPAE